MSAQAWIVAVGLAVATFATKAVGPILLGGRELPHSLARVARLLAPALLAALVAVDTLTGSGRTITIDARLGGVLAAAAGLLLRLNILVVVLSAAAVTALVRVVG